jgi:hypothetical protein
VATVKDVFALQAQDQAAGLLAVRARCAGITAAEIEEARNEEHSLIRTWAMRGTLHLMASEDYGWLLPYVGPRFIRHTRKRREDLGLTGGVIEKAIPLIGEALQDGELTRAELAERLKPKGIPVEGQAIAHLIGMAAYAGVLCYGADIGKKQGHALLRDWVDVDMDADTSDVPARLAERYLRAYAPATAEDFAVWAGIGLGEARKAFAAIRDDLIEVADGEGSLWMLREREAWIDDLTDEVRIIKLLPAFDATLLGYQSREWYLPKEYTKAVFRGGGMFVASLLVDGRLIGTWSSKRGKDGIAITVKALEKLPGDAMDGIEREVKDIGRFWGVDATLMPL